MRMTEQEAMQNISEIAIDYAECGEEAVCEALDMALVALGKQIPKKPIEKIKMMGFDKGGKCPTCQKYVNNHQYWIYCDCGQKLDWSEV